MGTCGADISVLLDSDDPVSSQYWSEGFTWEQVLSLLFKHSRAGVVLNFDDFGFKALARQYRGQASLCLVTISRDRESIDALLSEGFSVAGFHMVDGASVELIFGNQQTITSAELALPSNIVNRYTLGVIAVLMLLETDSYQILRWVESRV